MSVLSAGHGFPTPLGVTTTTWLFDIFPLTHEEYSSSHWTTQFTQSGGLILIFEKNYVIMKQYRILNVDKISILLGSLQNHCTTEQICFEKTWNTLRKL